MTCRLAQFLNFVEKTKHDSRVHKFIKNIKHTSEYRMLNHNEQPRSTNKIMRDAQLPEQNSFLHCIKEPRFSWYSTNSNTLSRTAKKWQIASNWTFWSYDAVSHLKQFFWTRCHCLLTNGLNWIKQVRACNLLWKFFIQKYVIEKWIQLYWFILAQHYNIYTCFYFCMISKLVENCQPKLQGKRINID